MRRDTQLFTALRSRFEVRFNGRPCPLGNNLEFSFLERLLQARGTYLSISTLGEDVWKDSGVSKNNVQAVVSNLRRKLRQAGLATLVIDGTQKGHYGLILAERQIGHLSDFSALP